ncbi:amino acid adenylation domain-containing protein [Planktotalea sp.]|uniref:amino acid adenylation domain-containing protein n=1 Tax=Planktotalea sp. TaxID=2029877 RepID=UPI00329A6990
MGLHALVRRAAVSTAAAPAIVMSGQVVDYTTLDQSADQIAAGLKSMGVKAGDRVGLWLAKGAPVVACMQAILRLGAAYVPVDPNSPAERARKIFTDCNVRLVLTTQARVQMAGEVLEGLALCLLNEECDLSAPDASLGTAFDPFVGHAVNDAAVTGDDLAYILYTSGSTGTPKGVCITHDNALAFIEWAGSELRLDPTDRLANHAPLHFDLSVLDLYVAFRAKASVLLLADGLSFSASALLEEIERDRPTVWYSVPSVLMLMMQAGLLELQKPSLKTILFAGEVFPISQLRVLRERWPDVRLLNLYGPTETNVCAYYEVTTLDPERRVPVPIGRACSGNKLWAQQPDGVHALPGEEGELFVQGRSVTPGYFGKTPRGDAPYATGDLVRVLEDEMFEYVGRLDHMVKLRGHRVEIGEIEAALAAHSAVQEVAVIVDGEGLEARLVAFVTSQEAKRPGLLALKAHCAAHLPRYMIIDALRHLETMPRTSTGKIDRQRLAAILHEPEFEETH